MRKALALSATLHLLLLSLMFLSIALPKFGLGKKGGSEQQQEQEKKKHQPNHVDILPKPSEPVEVSLVEIPRDKGPGKKKKPKVEKCEPSYGGIGIQISWYTGTITDVYKDYPADKADLRVGDVIQNFGSFEIMGEVGTEIDLVIVRNGEVIVKQLIREKICIAKTMGH